MHKDWYKAIISHAVFKRAFLASSFLLLVSPYAFGQTGAPEKSGRTFMMEGEREAASTLRPNDDGTYYFWFAVGGLDELDEGKWHDSDGGIYLNSDYDDGSSAIELIQQSKEASKTTTVVFETQPASIGINDIISIKIDTSNEKFR